MPTLTTAATLAASADRPNEDSYLASPEAMVLLDGAGGPSWMANGCEHGTAWYVGQLGARLHAGMSTHPRAPLAGLLAEAIGHVGDQHPECDLAHHGTPSATVVMLRPGTHAWDYLVLSDSALITRTRTGAVQVVRDTRIDQVSRSERERMQAHPIGTPEHTQARQDKVAKERALRNPARTDGPGHWIAATDPSVAEQALTGTLTDLGQAVLASDGALRWSDFTGSSPAELLEAIDNNGVGELLQQVRDFEDQDPDGIKLPRAKRRDDATLVEVRA